MFKSFKEIEILFKGGDYLKMVDQIQELLPNFPENPYLLRRLAFGYFNLEKEKLSGEYIKKAYSLYPHDGFVIWDYSHFLWVTSQEMLAIKNLEKIIQCQNRTLLKNTSSVIGRCTIKDIAKLVNDSRLVLGQWYYNIDSPQIALKYLKQYIKFRRNGLSSDYNLKNATGLAETIQNIDVIESLWGSDDGKILKELEAILLKETKKNPEDPWFWGRGLQVCI